MLKHNYHTHTRFCKHADEDPETIVKHAISLGFKSLGFSEHMTMPGDDGAYRLANEREEKAYLQEITRLKVLYQKEIKIYCGFECDISSPHTGKELYTYASKKIKLPNVDYLIIGHHWYPEGKNLHTYVSLPTMKQAKIWMEILQKAWATKTFSYLAHPDGFANAYEGRKWDEIAYYLAESITKYAAKEKMPLGFNIEGLANKKGYPSAIFWKIAAKNKASAIIELDAHRLRTFDPYYSNKAQKYLNSLGINVIEKLW